MAITCGNRQCAAIRTLKTALGAAILSILMTCIDTGTSSNPPSETCVETEPVCACSVDTTDAKILKVIVPNGGEMYSVGDTVILEYCSEFLESEEMTFEWLREAVISISPDYGKTWSIIIGTDLNSLRQKRRWVIPETVFDESGGEISLRSSQCLIRVAPYESFGELNQGDISDGTFTIQ